MNSENASAKVKTLCLNVFKFDIAIVASLCLLLAIALRPITRLVFLEGTLKSYTSQHVLPWDLAQQKIEASECLQTYGNCIYQYLEFIIESI